MARELTSRAKEKPECVSSKVEARTEDRPLKQLRQGPGINQAFKGSWRGPIQSIAGSSALPHEICNQAVRHRGKLGHSNHRRRQGQAARLVKAPLHKRVEYG